MDSESRNKKRTFSRLLLSCILECNARALLFKSYTYLRIISLFSFSGSLFPDKSQRCHEQSNFLSLDFF